ncbi:MAG: 2-hydroxyglutaryl-CoA dehydratase [Desulfobacteraceae bacterium]|nr:2-hydroxyglutaryl-CoA dehydratase [Desulfobacteraceae bacterium]
MEIGIDVGSTGIKIVFVVPGKSGNPDQVVWKIVMPTKPGQSALVNDLIQQGLTAIGESPSGIEKTCVTGYGRKLIQSTNHVVDEIWANAAGITYLTRGRARTLINVGGQDVKIIKLTESGQVTDFKMNDKCAAGTGRFFEIAANILDTPLDDFHTKDIEPVNINSICAVFAESEIVSLLAKGVNKFSIIKGINNAVARRIAALAGNGILDGDVYIDGGPANNKGLVESLEDQLLCDIKVVEEPQFTVALGSLYVD